MKVIKCVRGDGDVLGEAINTPLLNDDVRAMREAGRVAVDNGSGFLTVSIDANYTPNLMPRQIGRVGAYIGALQSIKYNGEYKQGVPINSMNLEVSNVG